MAVWKWSYFDLLLMTLCSITSETGHIHSQHISYFAYPTIVLYLFFFFVKINWEKNGSAMQSIVSWHAVNYPSQLMGAKYTACGASLPGLLGYWWATLCWGACLQGVADHRIKGPLAGGGWVGADTVTLPSCFAHFHCCGPISCLLVLLRLHAGAAACPGSDLELPLQHSVCDSGGSSSSGSGSGMGHTAGDEVVPCDLCQS